MLPTDPLQDILRKVTAGTNQPARLRTYCFAFLDGLLGANHTAEMPQNAEVKGFAQSERPLIEHNITQIIAGSIGTLESRQLAFMTGWCDQVDVANSQGTINTAVKTYSAGWRAMIPQFNTAVLEGGRGEAVAGKVGSTAG